jgi:hypothetical protein
LPIQGSWCVDEVTSGVVNEKLCCNWCCQNNSIKSLRYNVHYTLRCQTNLWWLLVDFGAVLVLSILCWSNNYAIRNARFQGHRVLVLTLKDSSCLCVHHGNRSTRVANVNYNN